MFLSTELLPIRKSIIHLKTKKSVQVGPLFVTFLPLSGSNTKAESKRRTLLHALPIVLDSPHRRSKQRGQHRLVQRLRTCSALVDTCVGCKTGCTTYPKSINRRTRQASKQPSRASFMIHILIGARTWGTSTN